MKVPTIALNFLCLALLFSPALHGRSQTRAEPGFQIAIQADADGRPTFTLTNLSDGTLTACHIRFSLSPQSKPQTEMDWDSLAQYQGGGPRRGPQPLEPGASMTIPLPHVVGGPLPDEVEVVAGIWADGETFGEDERVKRLLSNRASLTSAYEQAISLLQQGLDENWTRDQYFAALNGKPNSLPFLSIRSALRAGPNADWDRRSLQRAMQDLSAHFTTNLDLLRQAKPIASGTTSP